MVMTAHPVNQYFIAIAHPIPTTQLYYFTLRQGALDLNLFLKVVFITSDTMTVHA